MAELILSDILIYFMLAAAVCVLLLYLEAMLDSLLGFDRTDLKKAVITGFSEGANAGMVPTYPTLLFWRRDFHGCIVCIDDKEYLVQRALGDKIGDTLKVHPSQKTEQYAQKKVAYRGLYLLYLSKTEVLAFVIIEGLLLAAELVFRIALRV